MVVPLGVAEETMVLFVVPFKSKKGRKDLLSVVVMATKYASATIGSNVRERYLLNKMLYSGRRS